MSHQTFEIACMKYKLGKLIPAFRVFLEGRGLDPIRMTAEELDRAVEQFGDELRTRYLWHTKDLSRE